MLNDNISLEEVVETLLFNYRMRECEIRHCEYMLSGELPEKDKAEYTDELTRLKADKHTIDALIASLPPDENTIIREKFVCDTRRLIKEVCNDLDITRSQHDIMLKKAVTTMAKLLNKVESKP